MQTELVGVSDNIKNIYKLISRIAEFELSTVVYGETGVGKELVVNLLHQKSKRAGRPLVKVNCAALPETLLESEMFGYEKGAFTGARSKMRGKLEQSHGGVLFLDEIGDMSIELQGKLLHALQDGSFTPLGSERAIKANIWVIAATNRNLLEDIRLKRFREDLYFRLNTATIKINPLRERPEDLPCLIEYYLAKYTQMYSTKQADMLDQSVIDKLASYHWPGNVRELQNVLRQFMIFGVSHEYIDELLKSISNYSTGTQKLLATRSILSTNLPAIEGEMLESSELSLKKIKQKVNAIVEKEVIEYVLNITGWNRRRASKVMDISYRSLLYKIQEFDINKPELFR